MLKTAANRGGLPIDAFDRTIGFADFTGNRQYITLGNLAENPQAILFLIDYGAQAGQQIRIALDDAGLTPDLHALLMPKGYEAHPGIAAPRLTVEAGDSGRRTRYKECTMITRPGGIEE
jgi:hypothetical protein